MFGAPRASEQASDDPRDSVGSVVLDRYLLGPLVGVGASGRVHQALDTVTGQTVAIKRVPLEEVIQREITALLALRLPGVVRLLDEGPWQSEYLLVMSWVDGAPFPGGAVGTEELIATASSLLDVLDRVHHAGVVHRDLKPSNVLVDPHGRPTVLDLGLARGEGIGGGQGAAGASGTLRYVAPEQLLGGDVDPRSDLYSVGVLLYEALAEGALPQPGVDLVLERLTGLPISLRERRPDLPAALVEVVDRLVAPSADQRFPDARAAASALGRSAWTPDLPPGRLTQTALARWFRGHERMLRGPSTAARILWKRTGGKRRAVEEELGRWERAGVLTRDHTVDALALTELVAAEQRYDVALASPSELAELAIRISNAAHDDGDELRGVQVLRAALASLRSDPASVEGVLRAWERHVYSLGTPAAAQALRLEVRRAGLRSLADVERRVHAAQLAAEGSADRAYRQLWDVETREGHTVRLIAARLLGLEVHREAVAEIVRFAARSGDPRDRVLAATASGHLSYTQSQFADAARHHQRAARLATTLGIRLTSLVNAAIALLEAPDPEKAEVLARSVARRARRPLLLAWAEHLIRTARYRSGTVDRSDLPLLDAVAALGAIHLEGFLALTEAAIAFRTEDRESAAALATRAESALRKSGRGAGATLAGALAVACTGTDHPRRASIAADAWSGAIPGIAAQALTLLASAEPDPDRRALMLEEALRRRPWPEGTPDLPREILRPSEVGRARIGQCVLG